MSSSANPCNRRVLAIDPGCEKSAYVVWDGDALIDGGILPNADLLRYLREHPKESEVYVEMISSYGMRVGREVFDTCVWIGRFQQLTDAELVTRIEIKRWHTGRPSTKDADVRAALIEKYGAPGTKKQPGKTYGLRADVWQAFALATYVTEKEG